MFWAFSLFCITKVIQVYSAARYMTLTGEHPMERWAQLPGPRGLFPAVVGVVMVVSFPFYLSSLPIMLGTISSWILFDDPARYPHLIALIFIAFLILLTLKQSYGLLEKAQTSLVGLMLLIMLIATVAANPDWIAALMGAVVPTFPVYPEWVSRNPMFADRTLIVEMVAYMGVIGGGVQDALWLQICSDVTGLPQAVPRQTIGAAYGDAYLAGMAAGLFSDYSALRDSWVTIERRIQPDLEAKATYDALYPVYRDLYRDTRRHMRRLSQLNANEPPNKELIMSAKKADKDADNLAAVLDKIPQMFGDEAEVGRRMHDVIMEAAPALKPRLWYGMPGYALGRSKPVLVFIRKDDYLTFGLTEKATLPIGADAPDKLIANAWFLTGLDAATEARLAEIVRGAVG
jgi:hypothetical protein